MPNYTLINLLATCDSDCLVKKSLIIRVQMIVWPILERIYFFYSIIDQILVSIEEIDMNLIEHQQVFVVVYKIFSTNAGLETEIIQI